MYYARSNIVPSFPPLPPPPPFSRPPHRGFAEKSFFSAISSAGVGCWKVPGGTRTESLEKRYFFRFGKQNGDGGVKPPKGALPWCFENPNFLKRRPSASRKLFFDEANFDNNVKYSIHRRANQTLSFGEIFSKIRNFKAAAPTPPTCDPFPPPQVVTGKLGSRGESGDTASQEPSRFLGPRKQFWGRPGSSCSAARGNPDF